MSKKITQNQLIGEIGETAAKLRFLKIGFQFDGRSRLEAGIDGIAEVMENQTPTARMIAVQVKATNSERYPSEDDEKFTYTIRAKDLGYWRGSNLPVILVLYRQSDETIYWQEIPDALTDGERRLSFQKKRDLLDVNAVDRLAALTVPKTGFGYYVPPLGGGEEALVNILPIELPSEIYIASTSYSGKKAASIILDSEYPARFDWVIKGGTFWSFHDPASSSCRDIVDLDQIESIDTKYLAFHDDIDERNNFSFLLKNTLKHQYQKDLGWDKQSGSLYFRALNKNTPRKFHYESSKKKTHSDVVNVVKNKQFDDRTAFVRHHAFSPRFELIGNEWFLLISPTYFFTTNGFTPHSYPQALLSGKKRMDNSSSLRGQVIMWHRFLTKHVAEKDDLFGGQDDSEEFLQFGAPPLVSLETRVPEDVWGKPKTHENENDNQQKLAM